MNKTALATIFKYNMIRRGDTVLAALSGGADSVALLHFLHRNAGELGISVGALHLNHNLRGEESARDEAFVRALCGAWGVPLEVRSEQIAELAGSSGESVELCGRERRYAFFAEEAERQGAKVATAHTLSDSAETMLLNLARGTGLRGLCGIPPVRMPYIRPLIGCTRTQIEAYCAQNGLSFVEDSTNAGDQYARNRLRHAVMPGLASVNPGAERALGAAAELLRVDADYLDGVAAAELEKLRCPEGYDRGGLLALPAAIAPRVLRLQLARRGLPCDRARTLRLLALLRAGGGEQLSGEYYLVCSGDFYKIDGKLPEQPYFEVEAPLPPEGGETAAEVFPGKRIRFLRIRRENYKFFFKILNDPLKNALDCDRIDKIVILRQRKPGDALRPAGRGCSKTLRKLFNEAALEPRERSRTVVLVSGGKPVWVEGFGADESVAVTEETRWVLLPETVEGEC